MPLRPWRRKRKTLRQSRRLKVLSQILKSARLNPPRKPLANRNDALHFTSPRLFASRALAHRHHGFSSRAHRSRRSCAANARRRRHGFRFNSASPRPGPRSDDSCSVWPLSRRSRARQSRRIISFSAARAPRRSRTLSCHARTRLRSADRLLRDWNSRGPARSAAPWKTRRPRRRLFHFARTLHSEFRARPAAHFDFLRAHRLAAGQRTRRHLASHPAGHHAGSRACRDSHAHGAHLGARTAGERLRPHRARQGPHRTRRPVASRISQRADSHSHHSRLAIWYASRRNHCYRNDFLLAGHRPPRRASHRSTRLSAAARLHSCHCCFIRPGKSADGSGLRVRRSACAPAMKALREFLRHSVPGSVGFVLCVILIILAVGAPWLAPYNPAAQNLPARLVPPSAAHWMGTDELGRDVLSRVIYGARVSMSVSVSVVFGAGIIGLILGSLAGYFGGWFDRIVNIILINAFLSFPGILLAIAFAAFLGPGLGNVIIALTITGWAGYARLSRAQVLQAKEMDFVTAARSLGASHTRILVRHLLPNIIQPVLVQGTIALAGAILAESTLSFLGLGVLAPMSSWGAMLNDARGHLFDAPHMVIFPALAVMTAVLAFNLLGDALRDWMDPRIRSYLVVTDLAR